MEAWMYGAEIAVSEHPFDKLPETQLARVSPVEAEFWSIRIPPPLDERGNPIAGGIRSLGAFHDFDEFIALIWEYRDIIDRDFDACVQAVQEAWSDIFSSEPPHKRDKLHEYLSRFVAYNPAG
jgi:hypothetical protein